MARTSLPPGFRFHPTDVELIMYYLKRKVMGKKLLFKAIAEVNIYKFSPWDLPDKSCLKNKDLEWFFFCPREKKYASGVRVKRATENGYWKTTGKDRPISHNDRTVGSVKTLVFHLGTAPKGERTDWVIHEYKIVDDQLAAAGVQDTFVLCKVFKKNGPGPKNGAQYGAPFDEAEWADVEDDTPNQAMSLASDGPSSLFTPGSTSALLAEEGPSPSAVHPTPTSEVLVDETDDEIVRLLESFTEDDTLLSNENGINQDDLTGKGKNKRLASWDANDIYNGLDDLNSWNSWAQMYQGTLDFSGMQKDGYLLNNILPQDNSAYIELNDFLAPLNYPHKVPRTDQSPLGDIFGSHSYDNSQQFRPGPSFASTNQYSSGPNQLPMMPEGFQPGNNCLDGFQMADNQFYQGSNVAYDMDFAFAQPDNNGFNSNNQDSERENGSLKKIC
ncbi:hypothetical protein ACP275_08G096100 [Erythranthe tilingii]